MPMSPKSRANEEHRNKEQVDQAAKIEVSKIDLDWQHKGELFLARWAHDASGHQGRDATYRWARDRGVDLTMDSISQVIHDCETCAAIKQAKRATIRDLCKAHRDYGRDSPYFRGLLRSNLEAAVVIPADLRQLFSCLLDFTEFKLWEAAWRQLLREALPSLLTDPETVIDENGNALTLEQLMGEGRWMDPTDQASSISIKALQTIREHEVTAFFSMVPDGPIIPYYKIVQGTKEAFTKFVERLTRALKSKYQKWP
ncbi:hypothetical protein DUI87_01620 [Hirundo rustica rustica]|uniref:Uncharacterized protein n=1 Tax=Hirundo rustica rustica TaxID=333673 RepID=A0A3M0L5Y4_HIRRU|nr:hypothetical protein DUI87_01620 [Hirundo rustica rustica]